MLALPLMHGASGLWDEAILVVEGIVVLALIIAYVRGRRRPKPPSSDSPSGTPNQAGR
jgi:hypothetical protein